MTAETAALQSQLRESFRELDSLLLPLAKKHELPPPTTAGPLSPAKPAAGSGQTAFPASFSSTGVAAPPTSDLQFPSLISALPMEPAQQGQASAVGAAGMLASGRAAGHAPFSGGSALSDPSAILRVNTLAESLQEAQAPLQALLRGVSLAWVLQQQGAEGATGSSMEAAGAGSEGTAAASPPSSVSAASPGQRRKVVLRLSDDYTMLLLTVVSSTSSFTAVPPSAAGSSGSSTLKLDMQGLEEVSLDAGDSKLFCLHFSTGQATCLMAADGFQRQDIVLGLTLARQLLPSASVVG